MRRPLSMLVAAAVAASALGFAPAQARTAQAPAPIVTSDGSAVTQIRDRDHRRWKHRRHADRHWKHRRHHRRSFHSQLYFPFPFVAPYAFAPRYSYAPRYQCHGRLVQGRDGRLHCIPY